MILQQKIDTLKSFVVYNNGIPIPVLCSEAPMKVINMISILTTAAIN